MSVQEKLPSTAAQTLDGVDEQALKQREERLLRRMAELEKREKSLKEREAAVIATEQEKKQVLLRIPLSLWLSLARWADQDLRSINGQIEYLLTRAVREKKKEG